MALCLLLAMAAAHHACAQQPVRGQSVYDRVRPDYAPIGARLGAFVFDPYVAGSLLFDDNIFFTPDNRTSDMIARSSFGLLSRLDLRDLSLRLDTGGDIVRYLETTSQNYWEAHFSADGRYDIDPGLAVFGQVEASRLAQPRDAVDVVSSLTPTIYYDAHASVGFTKNSGRFNTAATAASESSTRTPRAPTTRPSTTHRSTATSGPWSATTMWGLRVPSSDSRATSGSILCRSTMPDFATAPWASR